MKYLLLVFASSLIVANTQAQTPDQLKKMLCRQWQFTGGTADGEKVPMDEMANSFMLFKPGGMLIFTNQGDSDTLTWTLSGTKNLQFDEEGDKHPCKIVKISDKELVLESNEEDVMMKSFFKYQPVIYHQKPVTVEQLEQNLQPGFAALKQLFKEILYKDVTIEQRDGLVYTSFREEKGADDFFRVISRNDDVVGSYATVHEDEYLQLKAALINKGYQLKNGETSKGPEMYVNSKYAVQFAPLSTSRGTFTVDIYDLSAFKF